MGLQHDKSIDPLRQNKISSFLTLWFSITDQREEVSPLLIGWTFDGMSGALERESRDCSDKCDQATCVCWYHGAVVLFLLVLLQRRGSEVMRMAC